VFKKIVVKEGVVTEVDLYEPFKSFISDKDLECLTKEIKLSIRQNNQECAYVRSDASSTEQYEIIVDFLKRIYVKELNGIASF
jgi:hypothetical protein